MPKAVKDDIIVQPIYDKESAHGIILPDQVKAYSGEFHGLVVSVGPENKYGLKKNQKVLFTRHEGFEIREKDETYLRLRKECVLAVIR